MLKLFRPDNLQQLLNPGDTVAPNLVSLKDFATLLAFAADKDKVVLSDRDNIKYDVALNMAKLARYSLKKAYAEKGRIGQVTANLDQEERWILDIKKDRKTIYLNDFKLGIALSIEVNDILFDELAGVLTQHSDDSRLIQLKRGFVFNQILGENRQAVSLRGRTVSCNNWFLNTSSDPNLFLLAEQIQLPENWLYQINELLRVRRQQFGIS